MATLSPRKFFNIGGSERSEFDGEIERIHRDLGQLEGDVVRGARVIVPQAADGVKLSDWARHTRAILSPKCTEILRADMPVEIHPLCFSDDGQFRVRAETMATTLGKRLLRDFAYVRLDAPHSHHLHDSQLRNASDVDQIIEPLDIIHDRGQTQHIILADIDYMRALAAVEERERTGINGCFGVASVEVPPAMLLGHGSVAVSSLVRLG